ncbi:MAG TPA: NADP-dependent oxidoreductase [Stellaceae bacterium]|nr:NADP-dependent oxidoreductase [Stellaceae bacterium]
MAGNTNTQILFASRPQGAPTAANFQLVETPIPEPGPGEMLLRTVYLGLDPVIRLRMNEGSYWPAFEIGRPLGARTVCVVVKSNNTGFAPGDLLVMQGIWADFMISDGKAAVSAANTQAANLPKLDPARGSITAPLHILGITGFTAYVGLIDIGQPKPGETVVVSGASGAVGSVAGQIAQLKGCRVVGIAGGAKKCDFVTGELGFHHAVDYKRPDFADALKAACPNGIDVYFENVGGAVFDAVFPLLNRYARVPVCGTVSEYNVTERSVVPDKMPALLLATLGKRLRIQGFVIGDWFHKMPEFQREAGQWLRDGKLRYREEFVDGLANAPAAFIAMLKADTFGKVIVRVSDDPTKK